MVHDVSLWRDLQPGSELIIVKTHYTPDRPDYQYPARMIQSDRPGWYAFEAEWALPDMDVDGILYETGGTLIEYFSPEKHFNIFYVFRRSGESSGFYANLTDLPTLEREDDGELTLTWIDCWLDVVRLPDGTIKVLDEDEYQESGVSESDPELDRAIQAALAELLEQLSAGEWDG